MSRSSLKERARTPRPPLVSSRGPGCSRLGSDSFDLTVRSGIVTIGGLVERRETALDLLARVRHAEGVVSVRDRLSYPAEAEADQEIAVTDSHSPEVQAANG